MKKSALFTLLCACIALKLYAEAPKENQIQHERAEATTDNQPASNPSKIASTSSISAFTGKITKNKVRMRLQPNLESIILRELGTHDMVIVLGENEEFYAVQPPAEIKGYVFRTYVLDGVVEGNHVNVRLEPDLSAPIIAQLNSGDRINGTISPHDKKWLEITLPASTHFYVAKEYVEKIGDANYMTKWNRRKEEVSQLIATASKNSQQELQKPFDQINIDSINKDLNKVVSQYSDFTDEAAKAKELLTTIQTAYLSKKVAYFESMPKTVTVIAENKESAHPVQTGLSSSKMAAWLPIEQSYYETWTSQNEPISIDEYYKNQAENGVTLKGIIEPYNKPVKNRPGDYLLVNSATHLPIAYIYSTQVNLQERMGQEISLKGSIRDNHHFAYPAYYIFSIE
jgi:hypothetical protein